ncbi:transposase [Streptococcus mitis]
MDQLTAFPSDAHLASWSGLCPGSYESAGIKKSSHITQGNR